MFGTQWRSTYEEQVSVGYDGTMKYARADGSVWSFAPYGNPLVYHLIAPGDVQAATLTEQVSTAQSTASWTVTFENGEKRVFNGLYASYGNGLSGGPLTAIIDRNGNTTMLAYAALNPGNLVTYLLATVTDPAGRHLNFTYGSNYPSLVTGVTSDPGSGINVTYTYGTGIAPGLVSVPILTQVTQADNTFVTFTYDANLLITSVNDTHGKVLESHTYVDFCNAGLSSSRANSVDALAISYFANFLYYCSPLGIGTP
jgi:YD repeat-containing protein